MRIAWTIKDMGHEELKIYQEVADKNNIKDLLAVY